MKFLNKCDKVDGRIKNLCTPQEAGIGAEEEQ